MPKIYNKNFVLVPTYTPESLLAPCGKYCDEIPVMCVAVDLPWLRDQFSDEKGPLEDFIDNEATYDDFETVAMQAIRERRFAFAVYDDGENEQVLFPDTLNPDTGKVSDVMGAYHEFLREETVFDHICRKANSVTYNARKACPVGFMPVGGSKLVFSESNPTRYADRNGAETAFIDILRHCNEMVLKGDDGILRLLGPVNKEKEKQQVPISPAHLAGRERRKKDITYTRSAAADIVDKFCDVLDAAGISVPSPDDENREPNSPPLYGQTWDDLVSEVEQMLIDLLSEHGPQTQIVQDKYGIEE